MARATRGAGARGDGPRGAAVVTVPSISALAARLAAPSNLGLGVASPVEIDVGPGGLVRLVPGWVRDADACFDAILAEIPWAATTIRMFGRELAEPRRTAWLGEVAYTYSGRARLPAPMTPTVARLRAALEATLGASLPGCLANLYRDGDDAMGWHADDEPELGAEPLVASLSFGAARRFLLKPREGGSSIRLELGPGDLLVMAGTSQVTHVHALPRMRRVAAPRINLTYRAFPGEA
jgi:alkylated DNA repair dioxygenase AlkB